MPLWRSLPENKILDGKHRWLAYRKIHEGQADPDIHVFRYDVTEWLESLKLAIDLNEHGLAPSSEDKEMDAKRFYRYGITSYDDIAAWLHVGKNKISGWLARTVKEEAREPVISRSRSCGWRVRLRQLLRKPVDVAL